MDWQWISAKGPVFGIRPHCLNKEILNPILQKYDLSKIVSRYVFREQGSWTVSTECLPLRPITEVENETIPGLRTQVNPLIKLILSYRHASQILLGHTDEGEDSEADVPREFPDAASLAKSRASSCTITEKYLLCNILRSNENSEAIPQR